MTIILTAIQTAGIALCAGLTFLTLVIALLSSGPEYDASEFE